MAEKIGRRDVLKLAGGMAAWGALDDFTFGRPQASDEVIEVKIINVYATRPMVFRPGGTLPSARAEGPPGSAPNGVAPSPPTTPPT